MAQANVKAVITADDRASKTIAGVGSSFSKMAGAMGVGTLAAQGVTKAFDLMSTAATSVVKSAASFEQTRIGLENMLGSADKARKLLGDVSDFAAETPFEFPELAQATKQLVAFGFTGKQAFSTMKQLGDVSSAIGAPINDLAYLMGTLKTQGRAFMIDIRQFAQRGVPIYEALAAVFKTNTKEVAKLIEEGKVGFPQVQKAFKLMTAEGGLFHGAMAKQSKSLKGLWSTFNDVLGMTSRQLFGITKTGDIVAGSMFDKLRQGVSTMIEKLPAFIASMMAVGKTIFEYLQPKVTALFNSFKQFLPTLLPLAQAIGVGLVVAIGAALDAMNLLITVLTPVVSWLNKHQGAVKAVVVALGAYLAAMKLIAAYTAFVGFINTASNAMILFKAKAVAATAQMGLFKAIMGSPFVLTVLVAGAIAALYQVYRLVQEIKGAMEALNQQKLAQSNAANSQQTLIKGMQQLRKTGTAEQKKRANAFFSNNKYSTGNDANASGTDFYHGGRTMVGEQGPEEVVLPRGSKVIPNNSLKGGGGTTINITVPMMAGSPSERRRVARMLIKDIQDIAAMNGKSAVQMMDSKYGLVT